MKTYYIQIERQGNLMWTVKVNANSYEEAEYKALKAIHDTDDISETSEENIREQIENGYLDTVIDEHGYEVDLDEIMEEDGVQPESIYKLYMQDESGFENTYIYYDYQTVLGKALQIWDNGEGGYCRVSIHEVANEDDEISEENQIWYTDHNID